MAVVLCWARLYYYTNLIIYDKIFSFTVFLVILCVKQTFLSLLLDQWSNTLVTWKHDEIHFKKRSIIIMSGESNSILQKLIIVWL